MGRPSKLPEQADNDAACDSIIYVPMIAPKYKANAARILAKLGNKPVSPAC
jgi:hypothetical protein